MARNLVTVDQVVNDFVLTLEGDDYANNASDTLIHNYALRGIREMGFDLLQRVRSIKLSAGTNNTVDLPDDFIVFSNYIYQNNIGQIYGLGGGFYEGEYRLNLDQNRIEFSSNSSVNEIVIEYIADEARSVNPTVHIEAEEALRSYIYYKIIERKSSVPMAEKARARSEYYNERRKANARLKAFSKEEALKTIRKNFKQAPKY